MVTKLDTFHSGHHADRSNGNIPLRYSPLSASALAHQYTRHHVPIASILSMATEAASIDLSIDNSVLPKGSPLLIATKDLQNLLARERQLSAPDATQISQCEALCRVLQQDNSFYYVALTTLRRDAEPEEVVQYEAELKHIHNNVASFYTLTTLQQDNIMAGTHSHDWSVWDSLVGLKSSTPPFASSGLKPIKEIPG